MRFLLSCTAAIELPERPFLLYIHFNDEAFLQELNRKDTRRLPMLLSLIRMIQAFRDYQRNVSELSQLSDRELADIGLDRSDIPRVAAGAYTG
jgi:uncharacterized protein YjiS (DUF1127 family)